MSSMPILRRAWPVALLIAILALAGCGLARGTTRQLDPAALQASLQRFADEYLSRTVAAMDEYARRAGTPDARSQTLIWKLPVTTAAIAIVSSPNPSANLLDLITLAVVTRLAVGELWARADDPAALQPWLDVSRSLESTAWELASGVYGPEEREEVQSAIQRWWEAHADARSAFFARPLELVSLIRQTEERTGRSANLFSLVRLDPTAGLDPAVREVIRTRLFAERALYAAQRMPFLLRWHIELLTDQVLRQPQPTEALASAARLAESADRLGRTAETVGQAATQLPDRIAAERAAIVSALTAQQGQLRALSAEVGRTLAAGETMSTSINTTLRTFDALMKRFGVGEPGANPGPASDSPPFSILDYAHTAEQLTVMVRELNALFRDAGGTLDSPALSQRLEALSAVTARAKADAKSVLNHAFLLAAGLVLLVFVCALAYRWLGPRATGQIGTGAE